MTRTAEELSRQYDLTSPPKGETDELVKRLLAQANAAERASDLGNELLRPLAFDLRRAADLIDSLTQKEVMQPGSSTDQNNPVATTPRQEPNIPGGAEPGEPGKLNRRGAQWTYDEKAAADGLGHLYYFMPQIRGIPPYVEQREVRAIIDIASDGTLAGVELIDDMPPPKGGADDGSRWADWNAAINEAAKVADKFGSSDENDMLHNEPLQFTRGYEIGARDIASAIRALSPVPSGYRMVPDWQTIDSAPKDGTHISVININQATPLPATVHWFDGWQLSVNQLAEYSEYVWGPPTHWRPLPAPPSLGTGER